MKRVLLTILLAFFVIGIDNAMPDTLKLGTTIDTIGKLKTITSYPGSSDLQYLIEIQNEHNNAIISTVYWALSSILIVILAIVGSNIYFNFRFNRKQYEDLIEEQTDKINELERKLIESINSKALKIETEYKDSSEKFQSEIKAFQDERFKETLGEFKNRLESFSQNLKEQIQAQKERIDNNYKSTEERQNNISNLIVENDEKYKTRFHEVNETIKLTVNYEVNRLSIKIEDLQADFWKNKQLYSNALGCYIRQANSIIEIKWFWHLKFTLKDIIEIINMEKTIDKYYLPKLEELLLKIPEEYSADKSILTGLINTYKK